MSTCDHFLSASRKVAKARKGWHDRACTVFDHGFGDFEVRDYHDNIVWSGSAHCATCARSEAIAHNADRVQS